MLTADFHTTLVLGLVVAALLLFATERVRFETAAFLVLVSLLVSFSIWPLHRPEGVFEPAQFLRVFGNEALIMVCALMVLGQGMETTSALQPMTGWVSRYWGAHPQLTLLGVIVSTAVLSAFLNNTPIVVMLLPVLLSIAKKNRLSASKILLPIGLGTIVGGMATTIGTSTNLLVVGLSRDLANVEFEMFDFAWYVVLAGSLGLLYLWLVAPLITPKREHDHDVRKTREYVATLHIDAGSPVEGGTVGDLLERTHHALAIDYVRHGEETFRAPLPTVPLHDGDAVFVRGTREALKEAEQTLHASLRASEADVHDEPEAEPVIMEVLVPLRSELDGTSLDGSGLAERFGIAGVAIHRADAARVRGTQGKRALGRIPLEPGDIVLCEGTREQFDRLLAETRLLALTDSVDLPFTRRARTALAIMGLVIVVAALDIAPISISALVGVCAMLLTKCIAWRHVARGLSTQVILIIVASLALGEALTVTGGDTYLAMLFVAALEGTSGPAIVGALMLFMALLTNVVSNNAAAVIGTPIGIRIAEQLGMPVEPLILAVLFGANLSFATPISYKTNMLILTAGGYRFSDFVRVGAPLMLLMGFVLTWLLSVAYDL